MTWQKAELHTGTSACVFLFFNNKTPLKPHNKRVFIFIPFLNVKIYIPYIYNECMKKKLFAFDLDGTLLSNDETVSEFSKKGIKKLQNMGHEVVLITGRSLNMTSGIYKDLGLKSPLGVFNGAVIISEDKSLNYENKYIKGSEVAHIINDEFFIQNTTGFVLETLNETFTNNLECPNAKLVSRWTGITPTLIDKSTVYENPLVLLAELKTQDIDVANEITKAFQKEFPDSEISNWYSYHTDKYILEVSRKNARKDFALIAIANFYGIDMKDTIAFGDGNNDQHMLMAAGHGVAMLNAPDFVKEYADEITKNTNDNDGAVKYALDYIRGELNE